MKDSLRSYAVVDLFAGPGGLGEGFAAYRAPGGETPFHTVLSIEADRHAHRTLLLRSFLRKFENGFPDEYYRFVNGQSPEPNWAELAPDQWWQAADETRRLTLGSTEADEFLETRIKHIRSEWGDRTILIGGPPCQAYSVVGRARNGALRNRPPSRGDRDRLYLEYASVLAELRPAVAVMENVTGLLSVNLSGRRLFPVVLANLRQPQNCCTTYETHALCPPLGATTHVNGVDDLARFVVRAEEHGVPQARHRVFVVCLREDIADTLPDGVLPTLELGNPRVSVDEVIGAMPKLRSMLSQRDSPAAWRQAILKACKIVRASVLRMAPEEARRCRSILSAVHDALKKRELPPTAGDEGGTIRSSCPDALREWICDERIHRLANHETRGHMPSDLDRYLFAAVFAAACGRSPKTRDFPPSLAAKHKNWRSGSFNDRFRVQIDDAPATTVTSHLAKDGHYFIHPDPTQVRSLTVREAARLQTFPDDYFFCGPRTSQYVQVGNAVPPYLALRIAGAVCGALAPETKRHEHRALAIASRRPIERARERELAPMAAAAMAAP